MSRSISLALLAGALLLLAAATVADAQADACPPGCATCRAATEAEVAAWKAEKAALKAKWAEKKAAAGAAGAGPVAGAGAAGPAAGAGFGGKKWGAGGEWAGRRHNGTEGWGARRNGTKSVCLTCIANASLKDGRCLCDPGFGWPLPAAPPARNADGSFARPPLPKACEACAGNTASGPLAPRPDFGALKAEWKKDFGARGARNLLSAAGKWKAGGAAICVPCPAGQTANADHTACA